MSPYRNTTPLQTGTCGNPAVILKTELGVVLPSSQPALRPQDWDDMQHIHIRNDDEGLHTIHCPFCGVLALAPDHEAGPECDHLVYIGCNELGALYISESLELNPKEEEGPWSS